MELRQWVIDQAMGVCQIQDPGCTRWATHVDHIVPLVQGGAMWDPANLRASCATCNLSRGGRLGNERKRDGAVTYRSPGGDRVVSRW